MKNGKKKTNAEELYKKWYNSFYEDEEKAETPLQDEIDKYTENIIYMNETQQYKGNWTTPFAMKIPNEKIKQFLEKRTLEQLLEYMGNGNEPDDNEKKALIKFYNTETGMKHLEELEKKSKYKCRIGTSNCKKEITK